MPPTTEVASAPVVYQGAPMPLSDEARSLFSQDTVALLASKIGTSAGLSAVPGPLLYATLELAARYELDPFANEIWLAKMGGRDGGGGSLAIMVGRDGYLKVARRSKDFISCVGAAVYAADHFTAEYLDDETGWKVEHKITNLVDRGKPLGAWCRLLRAGKPAVFFFAPLEQFRKGGGAWKYEDAMIVKCAASYVLRTTYGISGAVPYDEVSVGFDPDTTESTAEEIPAFAELPSSLEIALARAIEVDPKSWKRNEVEARVLGAGGEVLLDQARRVEVELAEWLEANDRGEVVDALPEREMVTDADVISDTPAATRWPTMDGETIAAKWRDEPDSEWHQDVAALIATIDTVERALQPDAGPEEIEENARRVGELGDELERRRGVPRGWRPPVDGQTTLV